LFLTLDRLFLRRLLTRLPRVAGIGFTFLAVIIGWVLFRAPDARSAVAYYAAMINPFAPHDLVLVTSDLYSRWRWGWPFVSFRGWAALKSALTATDGRMADHLDGVRGRTPRAFDRQGDHCRISSISYFRF
jgi:hypothetical protein